MSQTGILLVNLGSPDSTSVKDVRAYLKEFLLDPRVIDIPLVLRHLLVRGLILPKRPAKSAEAYQQIWTEQGSPLVVLSQELFSALATRVDLPIALAMRYGNPSIEKALLELKPQNIKTLRLVPLYPHYAMSSYETVVIKVKEELQRLGMSDVSLQVLPPFYDHPGYIEALSESMKPSLEWDYDHLLFSYHGIPVRHVVKTDPSGQHCAKDKSCCETEHPAQAFCYKSQALKTTRALVKTLGIPEDKYSVSFQSRLGRTPWLKPFTDIVLEELPKQGIQKLLVICPSFVSDCLETLEEIQIRGKDSFISSGGQELRQIPCLNTHSTWVDVLSRWVQDPNEFKPVADTSLLAVTAG